MNKTKQVVTSVAKEFNIELFDQQGRVVSETPKAVIISKITTSDKRYMWQLLHNN